MGDIPGDISGEKAGDGTRSLMVSRTAPILTFCQKRTLSWTLRHPLLVLRAELTMAVSAVFPKTIRSPYPCHMSARALQLTNQPLFSSLSPVILPTSTSRPGGACLLG